MPAEHPWGVGMPAWLALHEFAAMAGRAFHGDVILVGSALRTKRPRDVDVRVEMVDEHYRDMIGPIAECNLPHTAWAAHCRAWSEFGRKLTGRPIDFQVQPLGHAFLFRDDPRIVLWRDVDDPT